VILRPATARDVADVVALERLLFGSDAWSEASVLEELTGPRRTALVVCLPGGPGDSTVVGYVVTAVAGDVVELRRIGLHPAYRRRGLARRLLREVTSSLPMMLEVSAANEAARAFYDDQGFVPLGRRERYYRDGSDALVLRRPPSAGADGGAPAECGS
jgi:[ribosomal protein S18]-alanine N-acetyltransferase